MKAIELENNHNILIDDRPKYRGHHPNATNPYSFPKLIEMQNWDLKAKVSWAISLMALEIAIHSNPVVAFSGGKSSEVVLHLVREINRNIPVVYNDTGVAYPETNRFIKELKEKWDLDLIVTKPKKTFQECVKEYGYPKTRGEGGDVPKCCRWLKEYPMRDTVREYGFDCIFLGNQASESMNRKLVFIQYGEAYTTTKVYGKDGIRKVFPVAIFTDKDIWGYIKKNDLPYNSIYDKGKSRSGCMFCTGYIGWKKEMASYNPKILRKVLRDMGQMDLDIYKER